MALTPSKTGSRSTSSRSTSSKSSSSKSASSRSTSSKPAASRAQGKPKSKATRNTANGGQIKTRRLAATPKKKTQRKYTDKELNLPTLNGITPAGVQKPKGKKKGKVFVDDPESMRRLLAVVASEQEGKVEGKLQRVRMLEEVREARRKEMEKKEEGKREKLEKVKDGLRGRKKARVGEAQEGSNGGAGAERSKTKEMKERKRVSFG